MFLSVLLSCTFPDQSHGTCVVGTEQLDEEQSHTLAEWDTGQSCPIEPVLVTALPLDTAPELFYQSHPHAKPETGTLFGYVCSPVSEPLTGAQVFTHLSLSVEQ